MSSNAAAPDVRAAIDAALMRFPYGEWVEMTAAAGYVRSEGLPRQALTTVIRTGRRRGVLLLRRTPDVYLVNRVYPGPYRPGPRQS